VAGNSATRRFETGEGSPGKEMVPTGGAGVSASAGKKKRTKRWRAAAGEDRWAGWPAGPIGR
jgi:hypothetical protein